LRGPENFPVLAGGCLDGGAAYINSKRNHSKFSR
jgi:hypothetical protein